MGAYSELLQSLLVSLNHLGRSFNSSKSHKRSPDAYHTRPWLASYVTDLLTHMLVTKTPTYVFGFSELSLYLVANDKMWTTFMEVRSLVDHHIAGATLQQPEPY